MNATIKVEPIAWRRSEYASTDVLRVNVASAENIGACPTVLAEPCPDRRDFEGPVSWNGFGCWKR